MSKLVLNKAQPNHTYTLELSHSEAHIVLRALATHIDAESADAFESQTCDWIAQRMRVMMGPLGGDTNG